MRIKMIKDNAVSAVVDFKTKEQSRSFRMLQDAARSQREKDTFNLGRTGNLELRCGCMYEKDGVYTSYPIKNAQSRESHGSTIYGRIDDSEKTSVLALLDGEEITECDVIMYEPGWLIDTGKTGYNIFGQGGKVYLKSIGSRNIHSSGASAAKHFKDFESILKYVEKNRDVFEYCAKSGYVWNIAPSCIEFKNDYMEDLSKNPRKNEKETAKKAELDGLLDLINKCREEKEQYDTFYIPENEIATDEQMHKEAVYRLAKLDIYNGIDAFKEGNLYMSEAGGILYDLNDKAKEAVQIVKDKGYVPFHVIRNFYEFGEVYAVLYVSKNTREWMYDRTDADGITMAYCYNATDDMLSEYGSIQIKRANGGLIRTA